MKRRTAIRSLLVAGAAVLLPRYSRSQDTSRQGKQDSQQGFIIRSDVRLVVLDVSVTDHNGRFVPGLTKGNFSVFENGAPQPITVFADVDVPVTVGILVDESRSMTPKRNEVLSAAGSFISACNPKDEIFVLNFNETVKRGLPPDIQFTDNIDQLRAALYRGIPEGRTALNDAVVEGLKQLEMGKRDKKALVLISDGGDNVSKHTRHDMLDMLDRSIATVYTIGIFDQNDPDRDPAILKLLARDSGGDAFFPEELSQMKDVCTRIAKEIRTRYTIGYVPPARNGGALRHIRLSVSAPGMGKLTAHTRTRYRYEETQSASNR